MEAEAVAVGLVPYGEGPAGLFGWRPATGRPFAHLRLAKLSRQGCVDPVEDVTPVLAYGFRSFSLARCSV